MSRKLDKEVAAMRRIWNIVGPFNSEARARIVQYLASRIMDESQERLKRLTLSLQQAEAELNELRQHDQSTR